MSNGVGIIDSVIIDITSMVDGSSARKPVTAELVANVGKSDNEQVIDTVEYDTA